MRSLAAVLLLFLLKEVSSARQEVAVYSSENCVAEKEGKIHVYTQTTNISEGSWERSANSYRVIAGLWGVTLANYSSVAVTSYIPVQPGTKDICYRRINGGFSNLGNLTKVMRLGPEDTSSSQIIFYEHGFLHEGYPAAGNSPYFAGRRILNVDRIVHFSNDTWISFEEGDFKGERHCHFAIFNSSFSGNGESGESMPKDGLQYYDVSPAIKVASVMKDLKGTCVLPKGNGDGSGGGSGSIFTGFAFSIYSLLFITAIFIA